MHALIVALKLCQIDTRTINAYSLQIQSLLGIIYDIIALKKFYMIPSLSISKIENFLFKFFEGFFSFSHSQIVPITFSMPPSTRTINQFLIRYRVHVFYIIKTTLNLSLRVFFVSQINLPFSNHLSKKIPNIESFSYFFYPLSSCILFFFITTIGLLFE